MAPPGSCMASVDEEARWRGRVQGEHARKRGFLAAVEEDIQGKHLTQWNESQGSENCHENCHENRWEKQNVTKSVHEDRESCFRGRCAGNVLSLSPLTPPPHPPCCTGGGRFPGTQKNHLKAGDSASALFLLCCLVQYYYVVQFCL